MITSEYEQLKDLADNNVCAADGGRLVCAWHKDAQQYYLKCGICGETKAITRVLSLTEEHRAGNLPDGPVKDNVEKSIQKRAQLAPDAPVANTLGGVPATDLGTGELLPIEIVKRLVDYAHQYDLDPRRGHVCLMYGDPYITIDGYLYYANRSGVPYQLRSRPLNDQERHDYQVDEGDHAWTADVVYTSTGGSFNGIGIVTKDEREEKSKRDSKKLASPVVARHPWQLAQKRAEWQALRRAFPIGESLEVNYDRPGKG